MGGFKPEFFHRFFRMEKWRHFSLPKLQAHRGAPSSSIRENSKSALRAAKKNGYTIAEVDVQLTRDQVPVLWHDSDLQRLVGKSDRLCDLSLQEARDLAQVDTLEEVLLDPLCPDFWNLELKTVAVWNEALERKVADLVVRIGAQNRVLFSSFNPISLWKVSQYLPEVPRALIATAETHERNSWLLRNLVAPTVLPVHLLHLNAEDCSPEFLIHLQQRKIPVALWTINDSEKISQAFSHGVCSVITDLPVPPTPS